MAGPLPYMGSARIINGVPQTPGVRGGTGRYYYTIADALASEGELVTVAVGTPQAGTTPGVVVGDAALSAVDDFYNDQWVVLNDGTPTDGLVYRYARVADYVGATRTFTLDRPWDFAAESSFAVILPCRIWLEADITEDVLLSDNGVNGLECEFNLEGHRLQGKVDITGPAFTWIRGGGGYITNGIQKSDNGALVVEDATVSRRDATVYALLLDQFATLFRCVLRNCRFAGVVAGRAPRSGWEIDYCQNFGVADGVDTVPYRLVESVAGVAIVLVQSDVSVLGEFSGCILYCENSLTGATAFAAWDLDVTLPGPSTIEAATTPRYRRFTSVFMTGSSTFTVTRTTGHENVKVKSSEGDSTALIAREGAWVVQAHSYTGTATYAVNVNSEWNADPSLNDGLGLYLISGTTMSGSITLSGTGTLVPTGGPITLGLNCAAEITGSVTVSRTTQSFESGFFPIVWAANQTAGAPSVTWSGTIVLVRADALNLIGTAGATGVTTVSVGTWTISGAINGIGTNSILISIGSVFSGGTITISSATITIAGMTGSALFSHGGTGGTITISGTQRYIFTGRVTTLGLATATGAGATIVNSGAVELESLLSGTTTALCRATTATSTARLQGAISFRQCSFTAAVTILEATLGGGVAEGPSSLTFSDCVFESTITDRTGAGTFTWATATWRFQNCHVSGLWTFTATSFTTVEAFETFFNGNAADKSITATGTRPTTYRFWACGFAARYDDLKPESIEVWDVLSADDAFVQGQPLTINATQEYDTCILTSIVEGASLDAPGANTRCVGVKSGRLFLAVNAAVASGDNLSLDLATPAQFNVLAFTPGQNGGRALEAAGATVAGKAYSVVTLR